MKTSFRKKLFPESTTKTKLLKINCVLQYMKCTSFEKLSKKLFFLVKVKKILKADLGRTFITLGNFKHYQINYQIFNTEAKLLYEYRRKHYT